MAGKYFEKKSLGDIITDDDIKECFRRCLTRRDWNGTVKEFISDGDYTLNIKGVINGTKNGVYPLTQAKNLFEALKSPIELEVTSWYLNEIFGITHVVVTDFQYNQVQGSQSMVSYEIQAISDRPIELFLNKV